jgi:hypothetical protein
MVNWEAVWTSAITALVVTVAFEYALKPRLEVRKQQLLDVIAARKAFLAKVTTAAMAAATLRESLPADADPALIATFRAEQRRHQERMQQTIIEMFDNTGAYAVAYPGPFRTLVLEFTSTLYGVVMSQCTYRRKADIVLETGKLMAEAIDVSRLWHLWPALRATEAVKACLNEIQAEADSQAKP